MHSYFVTPAKAGVHNSPLSCHHHRMKQPCVYILASKKKGTLYVGVTSDLARRIWEHRNELVEGFTQQYGVHRLVYVEPHISMEDAILREKRIKKWKRDWKIRLIEEGNPEWRDLFETLNA